MSHLSKKINIFRNPLRKIHPQKIEACFLRTIISGTIIQRKPQKIGPLSRLLLQEVRRNLSSTTLALISPINDTNSRWIGVRRKEGRKSLLDTHNNPLTISVACSFLSSQLICHIILFAQDDNLVNFSISYGFAEFFYFN